MTGIRSGSPLPGKNLVLTIDADLQAEVDFGLTNSREVTNEDLLDNTEIFLEQGDAWRENAEPHLTVNAHR